MKRNPGDSSHQLAGAAFDHDSGVFALGSSNVNPGYRVVNNAAYPQIAADYEKMFRVFTV